MHVKEPRHLTVLEREHFAAISADGASWDAFLSFNLMLFRAADELENVHAWSVEGRERNTSVFDFWNEYIEERDRAFLQRRRNVELNRILALDQLGDGYYPIPHILMEFSDTSGPFTPQPWSLLIDAGALSRRVQIEPEESNRARIFPSSLPSEEAQVPEGFDSTRQEGRPLGQQSSEKLAKLLEKVAERKGLPAASRAESSRGEQGEETQRALQDFRSWRDHVAHPVFATFVHELRAAGHKAWVNVRSVTFSPNREAYEMIELRIRFLSKSAHFARGHFRVSASQYPPGMWTTEISPREDSKRNSGTAANTAISVTPSTTADELETFVLLVLERLDRGLFIDNSSSTQL